MIISCEIGAPTGGEKRRTRKGERTEEDCNRGEDTKMATDEERTGKEASFLLNRSKANNFFIFAVMI